MSALSLLTLGVVTTVTGSSDDGNTECVNGVCTTTVLLPIDADFSTKCFTVAKESIPEKGYKEIDFSMDYLPKNTYSCAEMPACEECTTIGKQAFKGSFFDKFYMPHTVNTFVEQAFKEIVTSTGEPFEIHQLCNPADSTYTPITKDIKWAEKTDPVPILIRDCPSNPNAEGSGLYEDFSDGVVYIKKSSSDDMEEKEEKEETTKTDKTRSEMSTAAGSSVMGAAVSIGVITFML